MEKHLTVSVPDARGKPWKLELDGTDHESGSALVKIVNPLSFRNAPVRLADLRAAVDALEAEANS